MRILCERQANLEIEIHDHEAHIYFGFEEEEAAKKLARPRDHFHSVPHECDECGEATPDVDLWAEHPETGEEIWFCLACGEL